MDELTAQEAADLEDEARAYVEARSAQIIAWRTFKPHRVKHGVVKGEDGNMRDEIDHCPDCRLGLTATAQFLVCPAILAAGVDYDKAAKGGTFHDVIACGRDV